MDGYKDHLIYTCKEPECLPEGPGIYVFGRQHGKTIKPLYVGRAKRLRQRIEQQFNHTRLMRSLEEAQAGRRVLLIGEIILKSGQQLSRVLGVVESALIEHCLDQSLELFNKQGTKFPTHTISFRGNRAARHLSSRSIMVRRRGGA
jgi:hypothetical protein